VVAHSIVASMSNMSQYAHLASLAGDVLLGPQLLEVLPLEALLLLEALPLPLRDGLGLLRGDVRILHSRRLPTSDVCRDASERCTCTISMREGGPTGAAVSTLPAFQPFEA
jgi:hypothetical protein